MIGKAQRRRTVSPPTYPPGKCSRHHELREMSGKAAEIFGFFWLFRFGGLF
jgi:hypothetical protein